MTRQRFRTGWWAALFALVLAVFAVAPAAEAAVCGGETVSSHAAPASDDAPDPGGADRGDKAHGLCSHGHCHHGGAPVGGGVISDPHIAMDLDRGWLSDDPPLSRVPTGLDRPPRV